MRVLIIDDDNLKLRAILKAINEVAKNCTIDNATCGKDALRLMKLKKYDLLIVDLNLPYTEEEQPNEEGGRKVVNEIYRSIRKLYVPNYIVGLTQYQEFVNDYFNVWKVFHYESNSNAWIGNLKKLLTHITYVSYEQISNEIELPTMFVEGETDYKFINKAVDLFYPELNNYFKIAYTKGNGGASWVINQSLIWMNSYHKDSDLNDVKAISILDRDIAGLNALNSIRQEFKSDKQKEILKTYKLNERHNSIIKNFYASGIEIQFEIESLFKLDQLIYAHSKGWLDPEYSELLKTPKQWNPYNNTLKEYFISKGFNQDEMLYLRKVSWGSKDKFCNHILNSKTEELEDIFGNFKPFLLEVFEKLGLK